MNDLMISGLSLTASNIALNKMKNCTCIESHSNITRKLVHITAAPMFISTWQFYNYRYTASLVPIISSFYLIKNKSSLSKILSRSGDSEEIFKGPLLYTLVLSLITLVFWKENPIGAFSMIQLAIGDGFADIIGRKYGKIKWFDKSKSVEGSIGFFLTSLLSTMVLNSYINDMNWVSVNELHPHYSFQQIALISLVSALTEVFSKIDDNISIPLSCLISNYFITFFELFNMIEKIVK